MLTGSNHQFINFHEFFNQFYFIFVTAVMNMRKAWLLILITKSNHQFRIFTNFWNNFMLLFFVTTVMNMRKAWLLIYLVHRFQNLILKLWILNFHEFFNHFFWSMDLTNNSENINAKPSQCFKSILFLPLQLRWI